jgi:hypothetical protein
MVVVAVFLVIPLEILTRVLVVEAQGELGLQVVQVAYQVLVLITRQLGVKGVQQTILGVWVLRNMVVVEAVVVVHQL